jgi:hypothetical protein
MPMTEAEWLAGADPYPMLEIVKGKASDRKLRLFACACLNTIRNLITNAGRREMIEAGERWADRLMTEGEAQAILAANPYESSAAWESGDSANEQAANRTASSALFASAWDAAETVAWNVPKFGSRSAQTGTFVYAALLRDIIGNPFRLAMVDPFWLTNNVTAIARAIYDERAFDRMPILGDALEDAGCDNQDMLDHCRWGGDHVRGCWVVDLILGKK